MNVYIITIIFDKKTKDTHPYICFVMYVTIKNKRQSCRHLDSSPRFQSVESIPILDRT